MDSNSSKAVTNEGDTVQRTCGECIDYLEAWERIYRRSWDPDLEVWVVDFELVENWREYDEDYWH